MRALVTAAVVAASLLFAIAPVGAQQTQTWHRVKVPTPHWYTTFDMEWGKTRFDAIFIPNHGFTFTVTAHCNGTSDQTMIVVYGVGMTDGVWLDCIGSLSPTAEFNLNYWLMRVGELPPEVVSSLTQRDTDGFGPPPAILD